MGSEVMCMSGLVTGGIIVGQKGILEMGKHEGG